MTKLVILGCILAVVAAVVVAVIVAAHRNSVRAGKAAPEDASAVGSAALFSDASGCPDASSGSAGCDGGGAS